MLQPMDIQRIVLLALRAVRAQTLKSTIYSLSATPSAESSEEWRMLQRWWTEDIQSRQLPPAPFQQHAFLVGALMEKDDFWNFVDIVRESGIWINFSYEEQRGSSKYYYFIVAIEKAPR